MNGLRQCLEAKLTELYYLFGRVPTIAAASPKYADAGTHATMQKENIALKQNLEQIAAEVRRALQKLEHGTYGLCDVCGQPIDQERLEATPYATLCLGCAQALCSRKKKGGRN